MVIKNVNQKCAGCQKSACDGCSLSAAAQITPDRKGAMFFPESFQAEKQKGYGIAFDVGTTTVAAMLWNLEKGCQLGVETSLNPQRIAGSDVISRIAFGRKSKANLQTLHDLIVRKLEHLAIRLCAQIQTKKSSGTDEQMPLINRVAIAGNTAMCELLLNLPMEGLSKAPFHKEYSGSVIKEGKEFGFSFLGKAQVIVLPSIDGYAGADALAVYTFVRQKDKRKNILAVDIGTNGEILLIGSRASYACSAAAGPALEGAAVLQGMGAAPGAVEEVKLLGNFPRQDIFCKVIGNALPKGICGSGLVDALAVLAQLKVIDSTGYLLSSQEARKEGIPERICRRLLTVEGENRILLTERENPVYLTAGDIRQLQLAKGAVRAGIETLLSIEGIAETDLHHIYLAGAFGSYIKIENAIAIGLLPKIGKERITHVGNCAGTGASMALLSPKVIKDMEKYAGEIKHVELAEEAQFQELFLRYMEIR